MNAMSLVRERSVSDGASPDNPMDVAWIVLEAANDLEDDGTVAACRRVIDAGLKGTHACESDMLIVLHYFR
jgi:hypothetical protein